MMSSEPGADESIRLVKSSIEAFNAHDVNRCTETMAGYLTLYSPANPEGLKGLEAYTEDVRRDMAGLPDIQLRAERIVGNREWVLVQGVLTGTNYGPLKSRTGQPIRATGKHIEIRHAQIHRVEGGKITEIHQYYDTDQVSDQLGLLRRGKKSGIYFMILVIAGLVSMTVSGLTFIQSSDTAPTGLLAGAFFGGIWLISGSIFSLGKWILRYGRARSSS